MTTPSPFQIAQSIGTNIEGALQKQRERSNLDAIFDQIEQSETNDQSLEQALDNATRQIMTKVSDPNKPTALKLLENKRNQLINRRVQKEQSRLADTIKEIDPNSKLYQVVAEIYKTNLPTDQKEKLVKNITSVFPYRAEQQERLRLDSTLKRYNTRIKELDNQIKNARYTQRKDLEKQRDDLVKERDSLLDFKALSSEEKPKFNAVDPEHRAEAEALYQQHKDLEKVREILSEKYEL